MKEDNRGEEEKKRHKREGQKGGVGEQMRGDDFRKETKGRDED